MSIKFTQRDSSLDRYFRILGIDDPQEIDVSNSKSSNICRIWPELLLVVCMMSMNICWNKLSAASLKLDLTYNRDRYVQRWSHQVIDHDLLTKLLDYTKDIQVFECFYDVPMDIDVRHI